MAVKSVSLCVCSFYFFIAVSGELVLEGPICANATALYRCTGSDRLEWSWTNSQLSLSESVSFSPNLLQGPGIRNRTIGGTTVSFNITDLGPPVTNVIATVYDPQVLNGTRIECGGQSLIVSIGEMNLPTALRILLNESEVSIEYNVENMNIILYELSEGSTTVLTQPIVVNLPEMITFTLCQGNTTFTIDTCLLGDVSDEERNYTLFSNGTWIISRSCGDIQVNCLSNEWSTDINCPELPTSTPSASIESTLPTSPSRLVAIWIGVAVGCVLVVIIFGLVVLIVVLLCKRMKNKKISLEEMELNHLEDDANEYSTLTHPTPARSAMSADAYDTINSGFTTRQPPEAPSYGMLNGNAATARNRTQNRSQNGVQDRGRDEDQDRFQDRGQDTDSDTASHQYAKTKHIPQKSKSTDMMYSEVAMGGQDTLHPHLTTGSGVQYSGIQHGVRPEDTNLNLDTLLIQLRPVTDQYQELGVAAGLSQETIEEITSHAAVAFDGLVEVCDAWIRSLRRQDAAPTWRAVSDMLQEIGQEKLARDLLKVYITGSLPVIVDMHTVEIPKQATQSPPPPVPQRNDVDMDEDSEVAMATVVSIRRDKVPTESEMSPPPPIPPFHPNEDQAIAVPPRPPKKGAPQPGAPAIPPKPSPDPTPEAIPSLPPKPNKKA